jgi:hypothetical protein
MDQVDNTIPVLDNLIPQTGMEVAIVGLGKRTVFPNIDCISWRDAVQQTYTAITGYVLDLALWEITVSHILFDFPMQIAVELTPLGKPA